MVKAAVNSTPAVPGVYSATYSGIPVYEYQFGEDLKEHVMRRRHDNWINATHILKAAQFDKPARTRILERDVQKDTHEKIQGGYGKYQGTWIPLESGISLAERHLVYDRLRPIFEFQPGNESPPPAPKHVSKPKTLSKRKPNIPAPPVWSQPPPSAVEDYEGADYPMPDDDTPDNITIASASYLGDEDPRFDLAHLSAPPTAATGTHRKRKREEPSQQEMTEMHHAMYGDELLDYFLLSRNEQPAVKPDPPTNFQPDWPIDAENHTALHWASAMGDVDVVKQLKRFDATVAVKNKRGETPLMKCVNFTNCYEKQTFPAVMKELWQTVDARDDTGCTIIHHAAVMKNGRHFSPSCSRYYLDIILNKLQESLDPASFQQLIDAQDEEGNTALHMAVQANARKCIRALLGRHASTTIPNNEGVRAEDLIMDLNATRKDRAPQRSSSPFAPESQRHASFRDAFLDTHHKPVRKLPTFQSSAALSLTSRMAPAIEKKFNDLAESYDSEWQEKNAAEAEAKRILANNQAELAAARSQIAELETQLESDEAAAKTSNEANLAKHQVLNLITHQNRIHVQQAVDAEMSGRMNGTNGDASSQDESYEERLVLARTLSSLLAEQRQTETDYVDALSMVGTGEKIEKYRKLLKKCLDPKDGEALDINLDSLVEMMEEDKEPEVGGEGEGPPPARPTSSSLPGQLATGAVMGEPMDFGVAA